MSAAGDEHKPELIRLLIGSLAYGRAGLVAVTVEALRQEPFPTVTLIPATAASTRAGPPDLDALRSAAARFQSDVLVITQR